MPALEDMKIRRVTFPEEIILEAREIAALEHRTGAQYIRRAVEKQLRLDRKKLRTMRNDDEKE